MLMPLVDLAICFQFKGSDSGKIGHAVGAGEIATRRRATAVGRHARDVANRHCVSTPGRLSERGGHGRRLRVPDVVLCDRAAQGASSPSSAS